MTFLKAASWQALCFDPCQIFFLAISPGRRGKITQCVTDVVQISRSRAGTATRRNTSPAPLAPSLVLNSLQSSCEVPHAISFGWRSEGLSLISLSVKIYIYLSASQIWRWSDATLQADHQIHQHVSKLLNLQKHENCNGAFKWISQIGTSIKPPLNFFSQ